MRFPTLHGSILAAFFLFVSSAFPPRAFGYALEGVSWPSGATITLQMSLGSPPQTLQDGNTSWNTAAVPAATMWNAEMARVQFATVINSFVPTTG